MRLFIAMDIPQKIRASIEKLLLDLAPLRTTPPHQFHLIFKFLGEVSEENQKSLKERLSSIQHPSIELKVSGAGCFPNPRRPRVVWVGFSQPPSLLELQIKIENSLKPLGYPKEKRAFHPHLTLARIKNPAKADISDFLTRYSSFQTPPFLVKEFHLYSSKLNPKGAIHQIEETYPLQES